MKKKYRFRLSLILFIAFSSFSIAQTSLGSTKSFMNSLEKGLVTSGTSKTTSKTVLLEIENSKKFNGIVNYKNSDSSSEILIGEIKNIQESSFYIKAKDNSLEGHILLKKTKEAYKYYSDANGNAFVSKVDINTLICIDYRNVSEKVSKTTGKLKALKISQSILNLQSLPNAAGCVLLDFDGYNMPAGNIWNNGNAINAAPSGMSDAEIQRHWELVAEDYRPFNLNITTNEAVFNSYPKNRRMRVVITPTDTAFPEGGGVAYIGSFNWDNDVPCWVFETSGKVGGEASSHEIGHTFDLNHDGLIKGSGYYAGENNGSWAPIMGQGYSKAIVQWSKGEYANADNKEDDVKIIAGTKFGIGYRADDYGGTIAAAATLDYNSSGVINQKNGVISSETDHDFFTFTTTGGTVSINANTVERDGNLHLLITLYNAVGVQVKMYWNPDPFSLNAAMNENLPAGKYFISVSGVGAGDPVSGGYSAYGSIGSYSITGTIFENINVKPSTDVVTVYKDFNYSGFSGGLTIGDYNIARLNSLGVLNDDISSIKVAQGFQAILYQDDNFSGESIAINSDTVGLNSTWNDKVSSIRILANGVTTLDNQSFFLQNKNSGLNMNILTGKNNEEATIVQKKADIGEYQKFRFTHIGNGLYIINSNYNGNALTVNDNNKGSGVDIKQYPYIGNANQQFVVVATKDGFYKFIARHSGKIVEVAGASIKNGANLQQWDNDSQTCGQWKLINTNKTNEATLIQAEDFAASSGVKTEITTDVGGGLNVKDTNSAWLGYSKINFPTSGSYLIEYRVATTEDGAIIYGDLNQEINYFEQVNVPNTGGLQNWQTVKQTVNVNAGTYNFTLYILKKSVNINWIRISKIEPETTVLIQAEDYAFSLGIKTEVTTDVGGGFNVTNTKSGSSVGYSKVHFPTSGSYLIEYRVATVEDGAQLHGDLNQEINYFEKVNVPNTGGLQNWQTVKQTVNVNAGTYNFTLYIFKKNVNINWIRISKIEPGTTALIQAEDYTAMRGITTEVTSDVGGGLNITDAEIGDSLMYDNINFPTSGDYFIEYRVASTGGAKIFSYLNNEKFFLGNVNIPNTGGMQKWETVTQAVNVEEANTNLFIYIQSGPVNINWIRITRIDAAAAIIPESSPITTEEEIKDVALNVYPNPVSDVLFFTTDVTGQTAKIFDSQTGTLVKTQEIKDNNINVSGLNRGVYIIVFDVDGKQIVKRFIKK